MSTVTIPKKLTKGEELVVVSRKEYERFLRFLGNKGKEKKLPKSVEEGLDDIKMGRVTPAFSGISEFKRFLKKK